MSIVKELYDKIDSGREGKNTGLKIGIPKLDFYTGGMKKGVYTLVFSKSSVGKTSFVIYRLYRILKDYPDKDILIVYFSLELGASTLLAKLLSLYIEEMFGVELTYMQLLSFVDKLSDEQYGYVKAAQA
jgi:replicative DNA helicase